MEKRCSICGCTEDNACWDEELGQPCSWSNVDPEICTVCIKAEEASDD